MAVRGGVKYSVSILRMKKCSSDLKELVQHTKLADFTRATLKAAAM